MNGRASNRFSVLIIEDDPDDAELLRHYLRLASRSSGEIYDIHVSHTLNDAFIALDSSSFDVAIVDLSLPDSAGLDTVKSLLARAESLPIVVSTGLEDPQAWRDAIELGAQDYLLKGRIDGEKIERSVRHAMVRKRLEMELKVANRSLREMDRVKSDFLANASHELLTPLAASQGAVENLLSGFLGDLRAEQKIALERVKRNGERLLRLINGLLDLKRIEEGVMRLAPRSVVVSELLAEAAEGLRILAERRKLEMELRVLGRPRPISLDPDRMTEVFVNLLGNAIDHADRQVVLVVEEGEDGARVRVENDGDGIPAGEERLLFDRFHSGRKPGRYSGNGLGLAITKRLVEAHGGSILATNRDIGEGGGVRFTVTLPREGLSAGNI